MKRCIAGWVLLFLLGTLGSLYAKKIGYLGVYSQNLTESLKETLGVEYGVLITKVAENTPAERAGLKNGDVITAIDEKRIGNREDLTRVLAERPDKEAELTVFRKGEVLKLKTTLGHKKKKKMKASAKSMFGAGGGPDFLYFPAKLDTLNVYLKDVVGTFDEPIFLTGGGGCVTVWKNLRIGGMGASGKLKITGNKRKAELSLGYGGFLAEYAIPLRKFKILLGGVVGHGGVDLRISRASHLNWDDLFDNLKSDSVPGTHLEADLENSFFHYQPYLGIQFALSPWCYLIGKGGYIGTKLGEWNQMGMELADYPKMDFSNYFFSLGVYLGYFSR